MDTKNIRVIYKRITKDFEKKGFINLNHRLINSKDDLVEISSIFRDPRYETLRLIYMKDNKIAGYESITSKIPGFVTIFTNDNSGNAKAEKGFYKVRNRMQRLNANGYYMVHNHPSGVARASKKDLFATSIFSYMVNGFKGHLIINSGSYAWISVDDRGIAHSENEKVIKGYKKGKVENMLKSKFPYDISINSREDLINLMHYIKNSKDFSTAILTNNRGKIQMILDLPNSCLNMQKEQLKGYFKNLARQNGVSRVFFATQDNETYNKSIEHLKYGTFLDSICYKEKNDKIYAYENCDIEGKEIFADEQSKGISLLCCDNKEKYKKEKRLRIVFKEVGKNPKVKFIDNTLEAKQKLVGGLIEVIPYNDLLLVCNEEGKILNLPANVVFDYDYIAGNCFVVGDDYFNGDFKSLTQEEILRAKEDLIRRSMKYTVQRARHINNNSHSEKSR